jgi:hypothetical protein
VIRAATPSFCFVSQLGALVLMASTFVWTLYETDGTCLAKVWLIETGFTLLFASLFIKTARLALIFNLERLTAIRMPTTELFKILAVVMGIEVRTGARSPPASHRPLPRRRELTYVACCE